MDLIERIALIVIAAIFVFASLGAIFLWWVERQPYSPGPFRRDDWE